MLGMKLMKYVEKDEKLAAEPHSKKDEGAEVNASESQSSNNFPFRTTFFRCMIFFYECVQIRTANFKKRNSLGPIMLSIGLWPIVV